MIYANRGWACWSVSWQVLPVPSLRFLEYLPNAQDKQFDVVLAFGHNLLTRAMRHVWNFSAMCNQRPQTTGRATISKQTKPEFSQRVFPATAQYFDLRSRDTSGSKGEQFKNSGYKCQPKRVNKGGVTSWDVSGIVRPTELLE